jgi:rhodanese-related sulfurtransferase
MKPKIALAFVSAVLLLALSMTGVTHGIGPSPNFLSLAARAEGNNGGPPENKITQGLESVDVIHNGRIVKITRSGQKDATLPKGYSKVSRHCPPFCIQPMQVLPGVETIGELEVLDYLKRMSEGDNSVLVVDSREPSWVAYGTIPGSIHVPWTSISTELSGAFAGSTEADAQRHILVDLFGATQTPRGWDFTNARTLVLFCNGIWCAQSSANIHTLAKLGYPAEKMKWYRGGMQDWVSVGLTILKP